MAGFWRDRVRGASATRKKPIAGRQNEDAVLCRATDGLIGVFDGIGMYAEARMASQIARACCTPQLRAIDRAKYTTLQEALTAMGEALLAAQKGVEEVQRQNPSAGEGGTTAALAKLWQSPEGTVYALVINIGDSRIYHWSHSKQNLLRLTCDDNLLRQWYEVGNITEDELESYSDLMDSYTGEEPLPYRVQLAWEARNTIFAWLGMPGIEYSQGVIEMQPGDRLIATSDGIHDNLTTTELARIVARAAEPRDIALNLVDVAEAIAAVDTSIRAKPDDIAVAMLIMNR